MSLLIEYFLHKQQIIIKTTPMATTVLVAVKYQTREMQY